jgi:hypothetical protein
MENKETIEQAHQYIGECKGNEGNGCFLDSAGHNCGCFKKVLKETKQMYSEEDMIEYADYSFRASNDNRYVNPLSPSEWFQKYKK